MSNQFKNEDIKKYITVGTTLILVYWLLSNVSGIIGLCSTTISILMPFIIGAAIAFILNVPMRFIEKHLFQGEKFKHNKFFSLRRICAFFLTLCFIVLIFNFIIFIVIPQLVTTISELFSSVPAAATNAYNWAMNMLSDYPELENNLQTLSFDWNSLISSAVDFVTVGTKGIIAGSIGAVSGIVSGFTTFLIGFVFAIYILFQKEKLGSQIKKVLYALLPEQNAKKILEVASLTSTTFGNFLSGQCLEAVILGSMFCVTMLIIRLPYAWMIGSIIAVTALIPLVGAFIGLLIGIILMAIEGPVKVVIFIIMFLVLQQIEGNLIYPHVVGNSVGLPGIWVLVAVTVGGSLFGITGILLFIPTCSVCYALFRRLINRKYAQKNLPDPTEL